MAVGPTIGVRRDACRAASITRDKNPPKQRVPSYVDRMVAKAFQAAVGHDAINRKAGGAFNDPAAFVEVSTGLARRRNQEVAVVRQRDATGVQP